MGLLNAQPPREVLWVYDTTGDTGKTWLSQYLEFIQGYQSFQGGKYSDLAYAIQPRAAGYVIDLARTSEEFCCYQFMESVKNRRIFSPKYESGNKYLDSGILCVFSNYAPDLLKLSRDRWRVLELIKTPLSPHHAIRHIAL